MIVLLGGLTVATAFDGEIISDIMTSSADEGRALTIKNEQFWQPLRDAAQQAAQDGKRWSVFQEVDVTIASLTDEHSKVRTLLREAIVHLKRADDVVLAQASQSSEIANEELAMSSGADASTFSFLTGGQNFISQAIRRFIGGGAYSEKLGDQIQKRQAAVLPALRGASIVAGDVLTDCRLASKLAFDVLKYDIYNSGVPKTPQSVKDAANHIVDAAGKTRHHFMQLIMGTVSSITRDTSEKHDDPAATVTRATTVDLGHPSDTSEKDDDPAVRVTRATKIDLDHPSALSFPSDSQNSPVAARTIHQFPIKHSEPPGDYMHILDI